jgi:hypothetical protein
MIFRGNLNVFGSFRAHSIAAARFTCGCFVGWLEVLKPPTLPAVVWILNPLIAGSTNEARWSELLVRWCESAGKNLVSIVVDLSQGD